MLTNLSASLVNILYNFQLIKLAGEDGVAAYGAIMYVCFIFAAIFIGYSIGSAPVISYHYGAGNHAELKNLFRKSLILIGVCSVAMALLAELLAFPLTKAFVGYDSALHAMTCWGFRLYAISFLLSGVNAFGSAFFTALNNGVVSAVISFMRTLVFQCVVILILPIFLKLDGVWLSLPLAETLSLAVTVFFFVRKRNQYHYA